jgi:serine protease AprX
VVPAFSSQGLGGRLPDVVAPGVHVQSLRVPGSYIDAQYAATGAIDARFFRGSGTSQAAAFVSGAAALLVQAHPGYTPDQIKDLLRKTTTRMSAADPKAQGQGLIQVDQANKTSPSTTPQGWTRSTGTGTLDGSRGSLRLVLNGVTLSGERDINGLPFDAAAMAAAEAAGAAWTGGVWNGATLSGATWSGQSWTGATWSGQSWTAGTWTGATWSGQSWTGSSWTGATWTGKSWTGAAWTDASWS